MLLNINIITYKKYFLEKISHTGQTQRAQGVPVPRAAWGWQLVTGHHKICLSDLTASWCPANTSATR